MFRFAQLCGFRLHRPVGSVFADKSLTAATCDRYGREIIQQDEGFWRTVPASMPVVWRKPDAHEMTLRTLVLP
ncbi:hypothetical protein ABVV53_09985 [Novosphingobium sp. RD2P27]|uniref:Uncharacterized protein n=1 Tax=Novosphingobium kalidii TaxID=3230299 RepID=A0ABV2D1M1_9SPHN